MKATELIQQYQSGAITARELVEGVWPNVKECDGPFVCTVYSCLDSTDLERSIQGLGNGNTLEVAWSSAAKYTIARLTEIRQVREEIGWVQDCIDMSGITEPEKGIPEQRRILAREQSALAELSKGIRPEVL